jgi:leader peptidase (prepilin peptidase)/N-methyltransferase
MIVILSFLLGLLFGSFANVCILRLPEEQSIIHPPSHCPNCKKRLRPQDNIPLFSFLLLRGRSHCCHQPISWQYPVVEGLIACSFSLCAFYFRGSFMRIVFADVLTFYLLTISIIDYRHRIIPDELSLSLMILGLLTAGLNPFLLSTGYRGYIESTSALLGGGLFMLGLAWGGEKIFKKEALGGGDIKLVAAFGAIMGWHGLFGSLFLGSLLGGVSGLILLLTQKKQRGETLPFGPFLSLGIFAVLFLPPQWIRLIFP